MLNVKLSYERPTVHRKMYVLQQDSIKTEEVEELIKQKY